jgi:4-hydroxy-tetrahydrodipicolinate reductase
MSCRIGVLGAKGRMGREVIAALAHARYTDKALTGPFADQGDSLSSLLAGSDTIIDFSAPEAVLALVRAAEKIERPPALVVGSTGWKIDDRRLVETYANRAPVIMASNFSTGIMALLEILRHYSPLLQAMGYTPVITDIHHRHKKDAPSGTALSLQRSVSLSPGNVETHSIRAGEVIGDHEVMFYGNGDRIQFAHLAQDRSIFAMGAIDAALWLHEQRLADRVTKGLTGMEPYFKDLMVKSGVQA